MRTDPLRSDVARRSLIAYDTVKPPVALSTMLASAELKARALTVARATPTTLITCRRGTVASTEYENRPSAPVLRGRTYRSTEIVAPRTGFPRRSSLPVTFWVLFPDGVH